MPKGEFNRDAYESSRRSYTSEGKRATDRGEQTVKETGKLDPLVDPAGPAYGLIRPSRMRFEPIEGDMFVVANGAPATLEYELDTTGSMGNNVEIALEALPQTCELVTQVLPGRDPFFCAGIFGDVVDRFPLCRGQFEVLADRMVNQLTLMHPEGNGGDAAEDPQYGLFAGAFLTDAYLHKIGLKSMYFTITDAPMHEELLKDQLERIFGKSVFEKLAEAGYQINPKDLPSIEEVGLALQEKAHAFAMLINCDGRGSTTSQWERVLDKDHVIKVQDIKYAPHIMAAVTGLTEGTLDLQSAKDFLTGANLKVSEAQRIVDSIAHIPLGAQCALPNYSKLPKQGDIFRTKLDLWPIDPSELPADFSTAVITEAEPVKAGAAEGGWL